MTLATTLSKRKSGKRDNSSGKNGESPRTPEPTFFTVFFPPIGRVGYSEGSGMTRPSILKECRGPNIVRLSYSLCTHTSVSCEGWSDIGVELASIDRHSDHPIHFASDGTINNRPQEQKLAVSVSIMNNERYQATLQNPGQPAMQLGISLFSLANLRGAGPPKGASVSECQNMISAIAASPMIITLDRCNMLKNGSR